MQDVYQHHWLSNADPRPGSAHAPDARMAARPHGRRVRAAEGPRRVRPGSQRRDKPAVFGDLFLFRLRCADVGGGLARLQTTRRMAWQAEDAGAHQRLLDQEWTKRVGSWASLPVVEGDPWSSEAGVVHAHAETIANNPFFAPHRGIHSVADELRSGIYGKEPLRMPEAFRDSL